MVELNESLKLDDEGLFALFKARGEVVFSLAGRETQGEVWVSKDDRKKIWCRLWSS